MAKKHNGSNHQVAQPAPNGQTLLPLALSSDEHLSISTLETWLWDAACAIRGPVDAPKFKDFILPLIFYKRLSDVFDDEFAAYIEEYGDEAIAHEIIKADHADALRNGRKPIVRFYIPSDYSWIVLRNHPADGSLGEFVTEAMREVTRLNPELDGVLNVRDYNERQSGQRTLDDDRLATLIEVISRHPLGLKNTEPDILGRAYEYLLRKFAEGQGQSAGEFYTPKEVGWLIAELIDPAPYTTIYDPACGSGGLLIKARLLFEERHLQEKSKAPKLYGQELNAVTFSMAKMNMFLHDYTDSYFAIGDTFRNPGFAAEGAGLKQFDYAVANPMWRQPGYSESFYEHDSWGRFRQGIPPSSSADWGWVQHILASLNEQGRAAIVLDTGAISRGSGSTSANRERDIRKVFVENDWIESVILLPENLFYNTNAAGIILLLAREKADERKRQILLVNASAYFVKKGSKNELTGEGIIAIAEVYRRWETREKLSRVITLEETRSADYNLSPSQFVSINGTVHRRSLSEIIADLDMTRVEREKVDREFRQVLAQLGLGRGNIEVR